MRRIFLLILLSCRFSSAQQPTATKEYRVDQRYGGTWRDAEKSRGNKKDDWLCWAAAAANVLAWADWGKGLRDEDEILDYYSRHWQDKPQGSPRRAWRWWFTGQESKSGARVEKPGGGFWKDVGFPDYKWKNRRGALFRGIGKGHLRKNRYALKEVLDQGYGVAIQIVHPKEGGKRDSHIITLWGYRYSAANPFLGILITDSDDDKEAKKSTEAKNRLRYYPVQLREDGMWWFKYKEKDWKILAAYALARRSTFMGRVRDVPGDGPTRLAGSFVH